MPDDAVAVTQDAALGGRLMLKQPRRGHRFGHDAILLAAAVPARSGERVVELGAGVGAAGLALATRVTGIDVTLVEIEPALSALAAENIAANGFAHSARAVALDVGGPGKAFAAAGLEAGGADQVLMNPPFNDPAHQSSPEPSRQRAHSAAAGTLAIWTGTARRLLRSGGTLTLIWRADTLPDILQALSLGFGGIEVIPVQSRPDQPAIRVICRATRDSRAPLSLRPALVLNDAQHRQTEAAEAILRSGAALR